MKHKDLPKVEPVHIKPLFGLKPGLWLSVVYFFALLLALFFIGFLPGIVKGGKRVTFSSEAYNSAVYLDDDYCGGTPFTRFVASGNHRVDYKVNGVLIDSFEIKVGHPVFMTWMFPRKMNVNSDAVLNKDAYDAVLKEFFTDLASYSLILDYDDTFRYPPLFVDFVKQVQTSSFKNEIKAVFENATYFITTEEMKNDFEEACKIAKVSLSVTELSDKVRVKTDYENNLSFKHEDLTDIKGFDTGLFKISQICITESQFAHFLQENPDWSNKEELINKGLVDEFYLNGVNLSTSVSTNKPVRNVSYYAAEAYCKWLSEKTGKTVTLPSESQWISVALSVPNTGMQKSLVPAVIEDYPSALLGGLWELTSTRYIPHSNKESDSVQKFIENLGCKTEVIIKGGSYVSTKSVSVLDIGTSPMNLCSDYMGFRVIWY